MFDSDFNKEEKSEARMTRDLDQIRSFERELQESLMKTKLLKRLIQQRLTEEIDEPFGRYNFQKLLTLESSG